MAKVVVCETMVKPEIVPIPSSKGDGTYYDVIAKTLFNDSVCTCPGYQFRGTCKHVELVDQTRCTFHTPDLDTTGNCPVCHHPLIEFELDIEFE